MNCQLHSEAKLPLAKDVTHYFENRNFDITLPSLPLPVNFLHSLLFFFLFLAYFYSCFLVYLLCFLFFLACLLFLLLSCLHAFVYFPFFLSCFLSFFLVCFNPWCHLVSLVILMTRGHPIEVSTILFNVGYNVK